MTGKIIKGIAGFYYIHVPCKGVYECKAKGIFRKDKKKPLVGDNVVFDCLDEFDKKGNVTEILPRTSELIRPAVSNVDQAMIIFAAAEPQPNLNLLDRFLITMEYQHINTIICFNKKDIVQEEIINQLKCVYESCGYPVIITSTIHSEGMEELYQILKNKTTVLAGPSGVGKSSILNHIIPKAAMEVGAVSQKIKRGKHTTRHSELFHVEGETYLFDTPGFSSLYLHDMKKEELSQYFKEFNPYSQSCRFQGCAHISEPGCKVKLAVEEGKISRLRYENYCLLYGELKEQRRY